MDIVSLIKYAIMIIVFARIIHVIATAGRCTSKAKLNGKTVLITGANTGIGKETAIDMAARGARVILGFRDFNPAESTAEEIIAITGNRNVVYYPLDFESLTSVREFSQLVHDYEKRLDVLINNAGAALEENEITEDGLHILMQVNYFGPFLLTNLLLDLLKKSAPSRIVTASSMAHHLALLDLDNLNKHTNMAIDYCNSKLCNILMSNELARKLEGTNVTSNSLHACLRPAPVRFRRKNWYRWLLKTIDYFIRDCQDGEQDTIHCAVCKAVEGITGKYFHEFKECSTSDAGQDKQLSKKVWNKSIRLVKLQRNEIHY